MKKVLSLALAVVLIAGLLIGCGTQPETAAQPEGSAAGNPAAELAAYIPTVQAFTAEPVDEADVQAILAAGVNAPSAMNRQPWHFTAVTDAALLQKIADDMKSGMPAGGKPPVGEKPAPSDDGKTPPAPPSGDGKMPPAPGGGGAKAGMADAPLAIIVSCKEGQAFDAGLACQAMSAEANLLGYGTKIVSSPTIALNGEKQAEYRELLGIPEDQSAVAVLLVGREDRSVDGSSGATERSPLDEVVTFVGA